MKMTDLEIKNINAQLTLHKEIKAAENMILYYICSDASKLLNEVIKPKMWLKDNQKTVELTTDEFNQIRQFISRLDQKGLKELGNGHVEKYIDEKEVKSKILNMLS
jgi:hypothetical protein